MWIVISTAAVYVDAMMQHKDREGKEMERADHAWVQIGSGRVGSSLSGQVIKHAKADETERREKWATVACCSARLGDGIYMTRVQYEKTSMLQV
jgi:hypothetical protein